MDKYYFSIETDFTQKGYVLADSKVEALEKINKKEDLEFYDSYWNDTPNVYIDRVEEAEEELDEESMRLNAT